MHFMKDLFEGNDTEHLHNKFVRYSKGNFVGPLAKIKFSKANVKIAASFHFVDELLMLIADIIGNKEVYVKGQLIWNQDLSMDLAKLGIKYSKVTKSRGIFKYALENDVKMKDFIDTMGGYNILITIKEDDLSYVTKSSFPKPNKEFGADFCKVTLPAKYAKKVLDEFAFDVDGKTAKEIIISHEFDIDDIELPKDAPDFETARRLAKRVGTVRRKISVDGDEKASEKKFKV